MHIRNGIVLVDVTGFTRNQYVRKAGPPVESITDPDKLIGWWDFTNVVESEIETGAVDGSGTAVTNGDPINYIKNRSNSVNKLGNFLRSWNTTSSFCPTFGTNGCNGHSYADFTVTNSRLFATAGTGSDGLAYGGVGASSLSSATLNSQNQTMFIVFKPTDLTAAPSNDSLVYLRKGYNSNTNFTDDNIIVRQADDEFGVTFKYSSGSSLAIDSNVTLVSEPQIWTMEIGSDFKLYQNGDESVGNSATIPSGNDYTLNAVGARISLGINISNNTGSGASGNTKWEGHLYEVIIYDELLSETEITNVNNYLLNKYACINEEPVIPSISNHVGWWDFTDAATVFRDVAGTSNVVGQVVSYVGKVINKAAGDSGNKLGRFARTATDVDLEKPKWSTNGGANGQPYLEIAGPTTQTFGKGLIAGYFTGENADTYGGASPTLFDNLILESQNTTVIMVAKNDNATVSTDEYAFGFRGHTATSSTTSGFFNYFKEESNEKGTAHWVDIGSLTETVETTAELDTNTNIIMFVGDSTGKLYRNGILEDTEIMVNNETMDFDGSNTANGFPAVCIGSRPTVVNKGSAGSEWNGNIYEIHVYNKTLSTAELNQMLDYLGPKYGIATTVIT